MQQLIYFFIWGLKVDEEVLRVFHAHEGSKSMTYRQLLFLCLYYRRVRVWEIDEGASCVSRKIINKEFEQASICKDDDKA